MHQYEASFLLMHQYGASFDAISPSDNQLMRHFIWHRNSLSEMGAANGVSFRIAFLTAFHIFA